MAREPAMAAPPAAATAEETVETALVAETVTQPAQPPPVIHPPMRATWGVPRDQLPPWNPTWDHPAIGGIALPDSLHASMFPEGVTQAPNPTSGP